MSKIPCETEKVYCIFFLGLMDRTIIIAADTEARRVYDAHIRSCQPLLANLFLEGPLLVLLFFIKLFCIK